MKFYELTKENMQLKEMLEKEEITELDYQENKEMLMELINEKREFNLKELEKLIDGVHKKVLNLEGFNPDKFIVYKKNKYIEIEEKNYRDHILKN